MSQLDIFRLDDRVALVAGGGGAIGSALAVGLAGAGAKIAVTGRNQDALDAAVVRIDAAGGQGLAVSGDMTERASAEAAIAKIVDHYGRLDIVVNAIGGGAGKVLFDAQDYPDDAWQWIIDLNVTSTLLPTQYAVKAMIEGGRGGKVLNLSSVRGMLGINAGYSAYVAAKGAINSLTRQWATEWASHGINVNAISPTFVDTPQVAMLLDDPEFKKSVVARIPLARVGQTDDLIGAAIFFCSGASSFVTGQILGIDGGLTATQ
jgi:NAD(P)-dependent dehydrogenase (short-subunit alcohol dehydrogenase family)